MTEAAATSLNRQTIGMLSVAAGVSIFSIQDAIVKGMSGGYPVHEIVFLRSVVALPILAAVALAEGRGRIRMQRLGLHLLRGLLLYIAYTSYYLGIARLQIAQSVALYFTVPLFVTALSGPLLGERVSRRSWIAIAVGAAGMLLILRPGTGSFDPAMLLPLFSALSYALSALCARRLGASQGGGVMAFSATLVYAGASALTAAVLAGSSLPPDAHPSLRFLMSPWRWPDAWNLTLMVTCGLISALCFFLLGQGYRLAEANRAAPFEYASLPWGVLWGYLFFGNVPDGATILGSLVIVVGGLYALRAGTARAPKAAFVTLTDEGED